MTIMSNLSICASRFFNAKGSRTRSTKTVRGATSDRIRHYFCVSSRLIPNSESPPPTLQITARLISAEWLRTSSLTRLLPCPRHPFQPPSLPQSVSSTMCQQHIRQHICGHTETLKPQFCPLSLANGGVACQPLDVIRRAAPDLCANCHDQAVFVNGT